MDTTSGVPLWLQQVLPQWFKDRPATTERLWATLQSAVLGMTIVVSCAAQPGAFDSPFSTLIWFYTHWWSLVVAATIAVYKGQQAASKASAKGTL